MLDDDPLDLDEYLYEKVMDEAAVRLVWLLKHLPMLDDALCGVESEEKTRYWMSSLLEGITITKRNNSKGAQQ